MLGMMRAVSATVTCCSLPSYAHSIRADTLAIYEELVGHGSMRAELIAQENKRQQQARQRRANNHTGWE